MHPRLIVHPLTLTQWGRSGRARGLTHQAISAKNKKPAVVQLRAFDLMVDSDKFQLPL
jgi:hypothetical protein